MDEWIRDEKEDGWKDKLGMKRRTVEWITDEEEDGWIDTEWKLDLIILRDIGPVIAYP